MRVGCRRNPNKLRIVWVWNHEFRVDFFATSPFPCFPPRNLPNHSNLTCHKLRKSRFCCDCIRRRLWTNWMPSKPKRAVSAKESSGSGTLPIYSMQNLSWIQTGHVSIGFWWTPNVKFASIVCVRSIGCRAYMHGRDAFLQAGCGGNGSNVKP